ILEITTLSQAPAFVFDVGANVGDWTCSLMEMAAASGASYIKVHSFEPCLATYEMLCQNIARYAYTSKVLAIQKALSNQTGLGSLQVIGDGIGTNSLHRHDDVCITREETISLTTVDKYCGEHLIEHLVALKIDTEGHDQSVIEGAREMLD